MKRISIAIAVFLFFAYAQGLSACAIATFESPLSQVEPAGKSDAVLMWNGITERLILRPKLKGNAQEFGMVFAFPARPQVSEAADELFFELEEYTKPLASRDTGTGGTFFGANAAVTPQYEDSVEELETRNVGDFTVSVLTATDAGALIEWLLQNQYHFSENDKANFEYYVSQGEYFFAALKIRAEARGEIPSYLSATGSSEYFFTPIEFQFDTFAPVVPLRLARDTDPIQQLRLYTISTQPLVVWGGDIVFAEKLDWTLPEELSSLTGYSIEGQWLSSLDISIDPSLIEEDLQLSIWDVPYAIHLFEDQAPTVLAAQNIPSQSGIVPSYSAAGEPQRKSGNDEPFFWEDVFVPAALLLFIGWYIYMCWALYALARKLQTAKPWLAWIPIANTYLLVVIAGKKWWWIIMLFALPFAVIASLALLEEPPYNYLSEEAEGIIIGAGLYLFFVSLLLDFLLWERIMTAIAKRRNRPLWWGPASILVPPLGTVLFGMLAWGKENIQKDVEQTSEKVMSIQKKSLPTRKKRKSSAPRAISPKRAKQKKKKLETGEK